MSLEHTGCKYDNAPYINEPLCTMNRTLSETFLLHLPIQCGLAWIGMNYFAHYRYFMTIISGSILASIATADFLLGIIVDFRHLPISEEIVFTNFLSEMLKAYLFVNMLYSAQASPADFCYLRDGVLPLLVITAVETAQNTTSIHALRPFLIGIIPNVAAVIQGTSGLNPHMILWFRLALPLYSLRYLFASQRIWEIILMWFAYNLIHLSCIVLS